MKIELNRYQKATLIVVAVAIIGVQLIAFEDHGIRGYGWVISFLVAAALLLVALANSDKDKGRSDVNHNSIESASRMSREEIERGHEYYKTNGNLLYKEVLERAEKLMQAINSIRAERMKGLVVTIQGSVEKGRDFEEATTQHIQESTLGLVMGLVGMRRSKGKEIYVTGIEYKQMERQVSQEMMKCVVQTMKLDGDIIHDPDHLSKLHMENLQSIRKAIVNYCYAVQKGDAHPDRYILDWYEKRAGISGKKDAGTAAVLRQAVDETLAG